MGVAQGEHTLFSMGGILIYEMSVQRTEQRMGAGGNAHEFHAFQLGAFSSNLRKT